jgi:ornithine cyclodeaminase
MVDQDRTLIFNAADEALCSSQVCVTCTTSEQPVVRRDWVQPGTFVVGVGADHPHKHELDPRLLAADRLVVYRRGLAGRRGQGIDFTRGTRLRRG